MTLFLALGAVLLVIVVAWMLFAASLSASNRSSNIALSVNPPREDTATLHGYNPLGVLQGATFLIDHPRFNKGAYQVLEVRQFKRNLANGGRFTDYVVAENSPSPTQDPFLLRFFEHPVPGVESDGRALEMLYTAPHTKQHKDELYNLVRSPTEDVLNMNVRGVDTLFRRQGPAAGYEVSAVGGTFSPLTDFGRLWTFNAEFPADAEDKRDEVVYVTVDKASEVLLVHVGDFLEKFRITVLSDGR